jgi:hypothetical protein
MDAVAGATVPCWKSEYAPAVFLRISYQRTPATPGAASTDWFVTERLVRAGVAVREAPGRPLPVRQDVQELGWVHDPGLRETVARCRRAREDRVEACDRKLRASLIDAVGLACQWIRSSQMFRASKVAP